MRGLVPILTLVVLGGLPAFAQSTEEVCPVDDKDPRVEQADDVETCMRAMRVLYYKCQSHGTIPSTESSGAVFPYVMPIDEDCIDLDLESLEDDYRVGYRKLLRLDRRRVIMDKVLPDRIDKPISKK